MSKKKVLVIARWPLGGIRTYFRYIYSQPVFNGYEFVFVMPLFEDLDQYLKEYCPYLDVKFLGCENSNKGVLNQAINALGHEFDIVHSHGYSAAMMATLAMFRRRSKCPHLMTAHDVFLNEQFTGLKGKIKKSVMALTFKHLDAIHAVSQDCRENFLAFFPRTKEHRVHTILHGVDTQKFFNEPSRDFRAELGLQDQLILGFFGRFMAQKGFGYIIEAVDKLVAKDPTYLERIRVISFGWGGFIREEFEKVERLGLTDVFVQVPFTDNMPAAIKGVDAVVMPSLWEACGLLGMEALAAGTPIIGTNCIGLREVLDDSPALIVPPKDVRALSDAIESLFDGDTRSDFERYADEAVSRFSLDAPSKSLEGLYKNIIEGSA